MIMIDAHDRGNSIIISNADDGSIARQKPYLWNLQELADSKFNKIDRYSESPDESKKTNSKTQGKRTETTRSLSI
ncbi:uncharacterized protein G2W53_028374 [Senna tora]|uniref:Uncharacterized protein n=1 Tax=Senna tora TaxID=362788 RepID=A0A834T2K9_9FABA|nr:uncharacterized protein G2W53_028374 [Senna tora]